MDLDLDIIGRKAVALRAEVVREITESDLALLQTERGIKPTAIQRISERHHALARCLATGLSVSDACAITGYTPSRISILKGDPAFEELVAFYRTPKAELVHDFQDKAAIARNMATDLIIDKMEETPEAISLGDALDVAKTYADRSGHGPQSRSTHVHQFVGLADRMKARRQLTGASQAAKGPGLLVEGTLAPTISPEGRSPHLGTDQRRTEDEVG
jgi:hypothetical protein